MRLCFIMCQMRLHPMKIHLIKHSDLYLSQAWYLETSTLLSITDGEKWFGSLTTLLQDGMELMVMSLWRTVYMYGKLSIEKTSQTRITKTTGISRLSNNLNIPKSFYINN